MGKQDLFEHSPIRLFDKATNGGLKDGEIGLVTSKKGLGKTSVLVQFGMDAILEDKQLVHVSFDQHSANVITWYNSIFNEIAKRKNITDVDDMKEEMVRDRTILNFNQENFTLPKVIKTLKALKDAGIKLSALIIDGIDLSKVSEEEMKTAADFVKTENIKAWFSTTAVGEKLSDSIPEKSLQKFFTAVLHLSPKSEGVIVSIIKMRDRKDIPASLKLDSKTLLITEK
jgi:KaiC/GvpD/RAD55 family RecA-like ATPase